MTGDGVINLLAGHALFDIRIVGDGFQRDMRDAFVNKTFPDITFCFISGRDTTGDFRIFFHDLLRNQPINNKEI